MSFPDNGLGCAATSLQVHLGVGLVLMFTSAAVSSGKPLGKALEGACWHSALNRAAQASASAPLLVAHALIQARGRAVDTLTLVGLAAAALAVVLGATTAILGPMLAAGATTNGITTNGATGAHAAPPQPKLPKTLALGQVCSALLGTSLALLPFGGLPAEIKLSMAALLLRMALLVRAAGAYAHAVNLQGSAAVLLGDMEKSAGLAPLVSCLALLDFAAMGPSSVADMLMQPIVYCVFLGMVQAVFVFLIRVSIGGSPGHQPVAEFDVGFSLDTEASEGSLAPHLDRLRRLVCVALYTAMAVAMFCVLKASFNTAVSMNGFSVEWGSSPLLAAACLLQVLIFKVNAAEFLSLRLSPPTKKESANGIKATETRMSTYLKVVAAPAQSLVLALLLANQQDPTGAIGLTMALLTRYGLLAAAAGVALQVVLLLLFALAHANDYPPREPSFDCSGTLAEGAGMGQTAAVCLLQGGLALGLVGLGGLGWPVAGAVCSPIVYALLPQAAKRGVVETAVALGSTLLVQLGDSFTVFKDIIEKTRAAQEAKRAKQAAEKAALLLEEEGTEKKGKAQDKKKKMDEKFQSPKKEEKDGEEVPEEREQPDAPPKKKKGVSGGGGGGGKKRK